MSMRGFTGAGGSDQEGVELFGETADGEPVQLWPMRTTAARSLRVGDQLRISTGTHTGYRALITEIDEDEEARTLTLHGRLQGDEGLLVSWRGGNPQSGIVPG